MLIKEEIENLKRENISHLYGYIESHKGTSKITHVLEGLGSLPPSFDGSPFLRLLTHHNTSVRLLAVKNLGKLKNPKYIPKLYAIARSDAITELRREATSALGRMRCLESKQLLFKLLSDKDPKVMSQAIRGLLVFKGEQKVDDALKGLIPHENETVSSLISKAYFDHKKQKKTSQSHTESHPYLQNVVVKGDVREVLKHVPDDSMHLTFTSPPYYNAKDYSIYPSYQAYLDFLEDVFYLILEKTKEGRFLTVNTSPIIIPRVSRGHSSKRYPIPFDLHHVITKMGWEFIDDIIWMKPNASVKNRVGGFMQHRKPLGYKPNCVTEYVMVYRKTTARLIDWNIKQYDDAIVEESKVAGDFEKTNVWQIDPVYHKSHSAVFPQALCQRILQYYSFKGDLVFDPFAGSGTLGKAAIHLNRKFFLTEIDNNYFDYMKESLGKPNLFEPHKVKCLSLDEFIESK
ncbi:MAG: DNA methyltransferase [Flavobacteriaceae bacterium]|nr:DNA methyltransferase [Flavobacteriaceae bacterium]MCY4267012.1 DNA methyltransferase [Flavobacteriaceae bacterium]